ncbi:MAG: FAD-binding protein [bacterium]
MTRSTAGEAASSSGTVSGWGRCTASVARTLAVTSAEQVAEAIRGSGPRGIVARGAGRSYGDASQNAGGDLLDLSALRSARLSDDGAEVTVDAGMTLHDLLAWMLPRGLMVPVSPGTGRVTIGGMVAADVHGKNHHVDGSFGTHVTRIEIVDGRGDLRTLSPGEPEFWATVGGMGLTGVITRVSFAPVPVSTSYLLVDVQRHDDLGELMDAMRERDREVRYSVAWLDSVGRGGPLGRGILSGGVHASPDDLGPRLRRNPLDPGHERMLGTPRWVPGGLLNAWTVGAFNAAWYAREGRPRTGEVQHLARFFHPLDRVDGWNRVYGPAGFVQYQFAVPDAAAEVVADVLDRLSRAGAPSFLTVLKRFGPGNAAPLSFPAPGWTLALDLPAASPGLRDALPALDRIVVESGGRFYLAKDAHVSPAAFAAGYPRLEDWRRTRDAMDPDGRFVSDLARRLELTGAR